MSAETLKEQTWRQRQEANEAVAEALDQFSIAEIKYNEARVAYLAAVERERHAIAANVAAWTG